MMLLILFVPFRFVTLGTRHVVQEEFHRHNAEAAVLNEVNLLLDHLFRHNNTAAFIEKNLIQRFTSSNPSGLYVQAEAFMNGVSNGTVYCTR